MKKKHGKRWRRWAVALLVAVVLVGWAWSRWGAWFHNPEEQPYVPLTVPHRVLLTFGDDHEQSRNVSWQCDSVVRPAHLDLVCLADSDTVQVKATGEVFRSRSGQAAYYVARLRDLKPSTRYAYRAVTGGETSVWYAFETFPDHHNRTAFLYVGDVQDTIGGVANRYLREAHARHPQCEFMVCGGDLTERPTDQYWGETFRDIDSLAQCQPMLNVTGNHDYLKGVVVDLERRFPLVFSYFLDSMVGENQVYTVTVGPAQLFLLDSNRELPYLLTQRRWLKQQLQKSTARWKIVVLHHPLFSLKGNNNLFQRWAFNDLIEDSGVDLVLQAHEHAYARMSRHSDEGQPTTPVYTVSHCSPKNYRIRFDDRFDKFGISSRYYQVVDVHADTLTIATYEVYGHTLYDSLQIVKPTSTARPQVIDLGRAIPEYMEYTPVPGNKKDKAYAERIEDYKRRHPERLPR